MTIRRVPSAKHETTETVTKFAVHFEQYLLRVTSHQVLI